MAPQRFEIDPARISALLPFTFVLERIDAETFRYRLAGTAMCEVFGSELRGTNFLDGWENIDRVPLLRQFSLLTRQGAVALTYMAVAAADEEAVECEVMLLPLMHTRETIDRVLGVFCPLQTPAWLGEKPATQKSIVTSQMVWPATEPRQLLSRTPQISPETEYLAHTPVPQPGRPRFRVVEGGLGRNGKRLN
jgi:hypothetical protein